MSSLVYGNLRWVYILEAELIPESELINSIQSFQGSQLFGRDVAASFLEWASLRVYWTIRATPRSLLYFTGYGGEWSLAKSLVTFTCICRSLNVELVRLSWLLTETSSVRNNLTFISQDPHFPLRHRTMPSQVARYLPRSLPKFDITLKFSLSQFGCSFDTDWAYIRSLDKRRLSRPNPRRKCLVGQLNVWK